MITWLDVLLSDKSTQHESDGGDGVCLSVLLVGLSPPGGGTKIAFLGESILGARPWRREGEGSAFVGMPVPCEVSRQQIQQWRYLVA